MAYTSSFTPTDYKYKPTELETISMGGQTARKALTGTLEQERRKARLAGRTLSKAETEGLTSSYFGGAGERLTARRGLALEKRGQDITAGLGYAGLTSAEKMKEGELGLGYTGLESAEKMGYADIASAEKIAADQIASAERMHAAGLISDRELAEIQQKTAEDQISHTSGFFGGGGFLGTGLGRNYCIIVTACTYPNSYEVNVAREYRDIVLDAKTLAGYYALSRFIAPLIRKWAWFKHFIKKLLVDRLIDHGEWYFCVKGRHELKLSQSITHGFLKICRAIGMLRKGVKP